MSSGRKDGYESISSEDETELVEVKVVASTSRSKDKEYWEKKWDNARGPSNLEKSIELLSEYSGYGLGLFGQAVTGRWNTAHAKLVEEVLEIVEEHPRNDCVKKLFFELNYRLTDYPKKDGDFSKITSLIREKTRDQEVHVRDFGTIKKWV